jgi:trypsin
MRPAKFYRKAERSELPHGAPLQVERLEGRDMPSATVVGAEPYDTMAASFTVNPHQDMIVRGGSLALSAGGKKEPEDTCHHIIGCGGEGGRNALMVVGDPNGTPPDSPDNHIDPNTSESPFAGVGVVSLLRGNNVTGGGTGVAIGPRHVLTAAHVVDINRNGHHDGADWDSIEFWLNLDTDSPVDQPDVIIPVARWYIHPDAFNPGNAYFHDDIAVIELSEPLPAGVPFYELYGGDLAGQTLHMAGYGRSGDGLNGFTVPASRTVKRVGQNVADYFEGQDDHRRPEAVELWQADFDHPTDQILNFLGGPSLGNDKEASPGPGDSGGPAFVLVGSNPGEASSYQIGGVITHGIEGLSTFGLFGSGFGGTVVSAYLDWIQARMEGSLTTPESALSDGTRLGVGVNKGDTFPTTEEIGGPGVYTMIAGSGGLVDPTPSQEHESNTRGMDSIAKFVTLNFGPRETTKTITIEVKGDSKKESNEYFYLDLFDNSSNSLFTKNRGIGMIWNDD